MANLNFQNPENFGHRDNLVNNFVCNLVFLAFRGIRGGHQLEISIGVQVGFVSGTILWV